MATAKRKVCRVCRLDLTAKHYTLDSSRPDGLEDRCIRCRGFLRAVDGTSDRLGYTAEEKAKTRRCAIEAIRVQQWQPVDQE